MSRLDQWLVRVAAIAVLAWFGWQLTAQTVVTLLRQQDEIRQLRARLMASGDERK